MKIHQPQQQQSGEKMGNLRKYLAIACSGAIGVLGIVLLCKSARCRHHANLGEKTMEGLEETVKGLNKAIVHIQHVFKQLKTNKS